MIVYSYMTINYLAVLICSILSMVVGGIWYGPLFGKQWMKVIGVTEKNSKVMQQSVGHLYLIQFLLTLFQLIVLAYYVNGWTDVSGLTNTMWIWAAFIVPTIAQNSLWTAESRQNAWTKFLLQFGYQFIMFVIYGLVLGMYR